MNRQVTSRIAKWHFAPTTIARDNLLNEGVLQKNIFVTGNTVIDALKLMGKRLDSEPSLASEYIKKSGLTLKHEKNDLGNRSQARKFWGWFEANL